MPLRRFLFAFVAVFMFGASAAGAQSDTDVMMVPVLTDDAITLDGDLADWATLPAIITNGGPQPSDDPATRGQLRWQVAAADETLYIAATITDDLIVAGQNGTQYFLEDSIEVYLNFGDLAATEYGPGIGQLTVSPVDRGNSDPTALVLSGLGIKDVEPTGFVFDTVDGWGFELAIDLNGLAEITPGGEFGLQMQANGSDGGSRNMKVSWSSADVDDTSFKDPSVFGSGVFVVDSVDADVVSDEEDPVEAEPDIVVEESVETTSIETTATDERPDNEPEAGRTLLIAAVISAASILIGGLWFERRRKQSEAKHAAVAATSAASATDEPGEDEFDAMVTSILDED